MTNEDKLNKLREKKLQELKEQNEMQKSQEELDNEEKNKEEMLNHLMRKILTQDAKKRLNNVKLVDEEKASKIEQYLLQLAQQDRLSNKITEEQIKNILKEVTENKSYNIKGMRGRRNK